MEMSLVIMIIISELHQILHLTLFILVLAKQKDHLIAEVSTLIGEVLG